ncbi:type II toxin-antitoxin system RelE/ParE family toxin [Roseofilum casamattae]|uniref:Type II toxin-antitoxin system RelE/ParE family toxin n=1 Tax=Roseofilum casamattae BLCC-M143 TaxID=3022442 RepID=A0ABT7BU74_9CYAN|nr:type II toxin-antitoxin system RelE/ParE family toxin [Roseofilum casamattae]MDJ1182743.1 type II toxin-antitoxin system RelE/ParE family toxin [Roseofilum casamattae BLCC-M143]
MVDIRKRPQVIRDLIDIATYIANTNLDLSDRFLQAAEQTFQQLGQMPEMGKRCQFERPELQNIRQIGVKEFRNYIIFYSLSERTVEVIRVIHGARDLERLLTEDDETG